MKDRGRSSSDRVASSATDTDNAPTLRFTAELWRYPGDAAWHFVTLPMLVADEVRSQSDGLRRGFGSVRVAVRIGASTWKTSVFPDSKSGSYVLPVKKPVRINEEIEDGDSLDIELTVIEEA